MNKKNVLWWIGLLIAILTAICTYCSCTAGITIGRSNRIEQSVTNSLDSISTTFSLTYNKLIMSDKFARIPIATANRSMHDLSCPHITTMDFGRLDCVYHTQLVEGDDLKMNLHSFLRAAPMPQPTFGKVYLNVRAFFVPNRILCDKSSFDWDLWRNNLSQVSHPYINESALYGRITYIGQSLPNMENDFRRLLAQFGFPVRVFNRTSSWTSSDYNQKYNPFALYAYNRIWWDWYRDSNLIDDSLKSSYLDELSSGSNSGSHLVPRYVCYNKDYFTTAKVWAQEGVGSTRIPTTASSGSPATLINPTNPQNVTDNNGKVSNFTSSDSLNVQWLRVANSLQKYLERNNIAGGRIMARYYARFGATPNSVRLDQSEYCGGFTSPLNIGDVTANTDTFGSPTNPTQAFISDGLSYAGQLAGKGFINGGTSDISYHCTEDGTFMVLASLVPEVFYYEGIPADLLRGVENVKTDYFTPEYENLGFEPLLKKQIAANDSGLDSGATDNQIFGFQPRYSNYKFKLGTISGDMVLKSTRVGMQGFHLARTFLNSGGVYGGDLLPAFTTITPEDRHSFDRIFTVPGSSPGEFDHFDGIHICNCKIVRPMSASKLPSLEEDSHTSGKHVTIDNGGVRM